MKILVASIALLLLVAGCNNTPVKQTYFGDNAFTYCKTVKELNEVVKHVGFAPIVASRNYVCLDDGHENILCEQR